MAIRILKEVDRSEGRDVLSGSILGGNVLMLDAAGSGKVALYDGSVAGSHPYGLAIESNVKFPLAPTSGDPAGQGYDYTDFNRGGKIACFINGGEFELFNDGRGSVIAAGTYAINAPVYADATGKIAAADAGSGVVIGTVVDRDVALNPTRLRIKLLGA